MFEYHTKQLGMNPDDVKADAVFTIIDSIMRLSNEERSELGITDNFFETNQIYDMLPKSMGGSGQIQFEYIPNTGTTDTLNKYYNIKIDFDGDGFFLQLNNVDDPRLKYTPLPLEEKFKQKYPMTPNELKEENLQNYMKDGKEERNKIYDNLGLSGFAADLDGAYYNFLKFERSLLDLGQNTSEKILRGKRIANTQFAAGNKSYNSALEVIGSSIISFDANQTQNTINDVKSNYIALEGPEPEKDSSEYAAWQRGFKTQLAGAFGMTESISTQRENRANELFELGLSMGQYKPNERDKILKDIIGQDLLAATGEVDYNQIKADIIREKTLENLLILQESPAESQRAALAQSRIKQINFVEPDDKRYLKQELSIQTYQSLLDVNFDMVKWNDTYSANTNDVDTSIIRELQTSLWLQDGTSKAFIAGDAIVAQLKLLNL